jgi:hypothetical protein
MSDFVEIIGADGKRRRARRGETLADGERFSLPMTFMDAQLRDALVEKYGDAAIRVVDTAGLPAGHRPGFLYDHSKAFGNSPGDVAYREKLQRLDAMARERRWAGNAPRQESEQQVDVRQMILDEARAAADAAREARDERMRNAWRSHHA